MAKIVYKQREFEPASLRTIEQANEIIDEYLVEGLKLTLRQLYYQFVSRNIIPNKVAEYSRLGSVVSKARLAGLIDWEAIEDRTRNLQRNSHWDNPGDILKSAINSFQLDHWQDQQFRPEVWIEKEALIGVVEGVCRTLDVAFFACKGYVSQSEMWAASQRFIDYWRQEQRPVIIYLGDHDPSGIDMTRDIEERQWLFLAYPVINRIALNMDQIERYEPPPNPAKLTDTRSTTYRSTYGDMTWELDALDPRTLIELIETAVLGYRDVEAYNAVMDREAAHLRTLKRMGRNWKKL